jgi:uncharacterized membrane protein (DUF485 family)
LSTPAHLSGPDEPSAVKYSEIEADPQFVATRHRQRVFIAGAAVFFVLWYAAYVLVSSFARDLMATPVFGNINIGVLMGFGQFASTFAITGLYIWFTNRRITPEVDDLRERWEAQQ